MAHLICVLSLRYHCALLPVIQGFGNSSFEYFVCYFSGFRWESKFVPVVPSGLEVEATYLGFSQHFFILFGKLFRWDPSLARPSDLLYVSASSVYPESPSFALNL